MKALLLSYSTDAIPFGDNVYVYIYMFPPEEKKTGTHMLKIDPRSQPFQTHNLPDATADVKSLIIPCYSAVLPIAP